MCGILGTLPSTNEKKFSEALNTLEHRGPDGFGIWHANKEKISLGHRRLSILDLSDDGKQPMHYLDRYVITFNGEIYNYLEIKKDLEALGYKFFSKTDTEVILAAFAQWGEKCLEKFNGMWSFAIWDKKESSLFITRDRFGQKPLFYAFVDGKFIFASEMKAIYSFLNELKPSKDFEWMSNNIFSYEGTDKCLIDGIKRFPAGHYAFYKNNKLKIDRYWNTLDHIDFLQEDYDKQIKHFKELFLDACSLRMRSDVPIGTALSGGLDSSATISTMAYLAKNSKEHFSRDWQNAFVASFPGTPLDESKYAKKVVENIGINAHYINIDPLKEWDNIFDYLYKFEELYITSPIPMIMTYKAVKESGVTVTIDGHGADELFIGYGHIFESLWDAGLNIKKISNIFATNKGTKGNFGQHKQINETKFYFDFMIKKFIKKILNKEKKSIDYEHKNYKKLDNFNKNLYIIFHESILPTLLRNYDRYSMINGVEIRMPFMDWRLVSYVFSLPTSSKYNRGYTKILLRDSIGEFMPDDITWRKRKIGFNSPIVDWMQKDLSDWFGDLVNSRDFLQSNFISDHKVLKNKIEKIISGKDNLYENAEGAWKELTPFLWEKAVLKKKI